MTLIRRDLTLDNAVLSGGAVILAADSNGPRRISMEPPALFGQYGVGGTAVGQLPSAPFTDSQWQLFDDGTMLVAVWGISEMRRQRTNANGGTFVWRRTDLFSLGIALDRVRNELYVSVSGGQLLVLDADTGLTIRSWATAFGTPFHICFDASRDELYVPELDTGNVQVFDRLGALLRSGTFGRNGRMLQVMFIRDEVVQWETGGEVWAYDRTSFATTREVTQNRSFGDGPPDHEAGEFYVNPAGSVSDVCASADATRALFISAQLGDIVELDTVAKTMVLLHRSLLVHGVIMHLSAVMDSGRRSNICANATHLSWPVEIRTGQVSQMMCARLTTQAAVWSFLTDALLYPDGLTLRYVGVPVLDRGHVTMEYRVNSGAWTGFERTASLSVPLATGDTLQVRATFNPRTDIGSLSYVGNEAGDGIGLVLDDPAATTFVDVPILGIGGSLEVSSATGGAAVLT